MVITIIIIFFWFMVRIHTTVQNWIDLCDICERVCVCVYVDVDEDNNKKVQDTKFRAATERASERARNTPSASDRLCDEQKEKEENLKFVYENDSYYS